MAGDVVNYMSYPRVLGEGRVYCLLTDYECDKLLGLGSGALWVDQQQVLPEEEERTRSCENCQMGYNVATTLS